MKMDLRHGAKQIWQCLRARQPAKFKSAVASFERLANKRPANPLSQYAYTELLYRYDLAAPIGIVPASKGVVDGKTWANAIQEMERVAPKATYTFIAKAHWMSANNTYKSRPRVVEVLKHHEVIINGVRKFVDIPVLNGAEQTKELQALMDKALAADPRNPHALLFYAVHSRTPQKRYEYAVKAWEAGGARPVHRGALTNHERRRLGPRAQR